MSRPRSGGSLDAVVNDGRERDMSSRAARDLATDLDRLPTFPDDGDERVAGYTLMGLPFTSGHYLGLRDFPASSFGPGYRSVWHRDPAERWTFYATADPEQSCARYFGAALWDTVRTPIEVAWTGAEEFAVTVPGVLEWQVRLARTGATRLLTRVGGLLPDPVWSSRAVLALMGPVAGGLLGAGRIALRGTTANGQHYRANPRRVWAVAGSSARLDGTDLGPPGPLPVQDRLGDFWLPQRGVFAVGGAAFEAYDPTRHRPATAGRPAPATGGVR
jgi:hypothetical protein